MARFVLKIKGSLMIRLDYMLKIHWPLLGSQIYDHTGVHDILASLLLVELAVTVIELSPLLESKSLTG